jgi:hypothetical protein
MTGILSPPPGPANAPLLDKADVRLLRNGPRYLPHCLCPTVPGSVGCATLLAIFSPVRPRPFSDKTGLIRLGRYSWFCTPMCRTDCARTAIHMHCLTTGPVKLAESGSRCRSGLPSQSWRGI